VTKKKKVEERSINLAPPTTSFRGPVNRFKEAPDNLTDEVSTSRKARNHGFVLAHRFHEPCSIGSRESLIKTRRGGDKEEGFSPDPFVSQGHTQYQKRASKGTRVEGEGFFVSL